METIEFDLQIEWEEEPMHSNYQEMVSAIILGISDPRLTNDYDN